jgi:hypothetical protein
MEKPVAAEKARRARNWDGLAAVLAALIGCLALAVSAYTAFIQRQQVRAQVWPYLLAGNDDGNQSVFVYNKGVGPAIVRTAQLFVDDKPQPDWEHALAALGLPTKGYVQSTLNPNVISAGEQVRIIHVPDEGRWHAFRQAAEGRMALDVCFCSTLDECWMYSDRHLVGYKAIGQLVHPVDRCPQLPDADVFNN